MMVFIRASFAVVSVLGLVAACGGAGANVGDIYEAGDASPDARSSDGPETGADALTSRDADGPDGTDAADAADAAETACTAAVVSYPQNVFCGPQGPGAVCQVTGTIYVCREPPSGPGQPPLVGCVLVARGVDKNTAELVTRTLCPAEEWVRVPDPTVLCNVAALPVRYNGPSSGPVPPNCFRNGGWTIDGVTGSAACCPS